MLEERFEWRAERRFDHLDDALEGDRSHASLQLAQRVVRAFRENAVEVGQDLPHLHRHSLHVIELASERFADLAILRALRPDEPATCEPCCSGCDLAGGEQAPTETALQVIELVVVHVRPVLLGFAIVRRLLFAFRRSLLSGFRRWGKGELLVRVRVVRCAKQCQTTTDIDGAHRHFV
ncbi:MAG: hypothetical protein IT381_11600 [Deltaproteobacteria bacterium]|nr:hypothetical protein [Deltaproteobacteria bacterium]